MKLRRNQSGATVVVVVSVIATLAIFAAGALDYTFTVSKDIERTNKMENATSIANGCIQDEYMYWREICRATATQGPTTAAFSSIPLPSGTQFPYVSGFTATTGTSTAYTVSNYKITAVTPQLVPITGSNATIPAIGTSGTNRTFYYEASATVSMPDRGPNVTFNAVEVFEQQYQNPWDWALFFVDPLEIDPGANMTIDGWVQTNSSLWTAMSDLTFGDKVNFGTTWNINFMPSDPSHNGDTPATPSWPSGLPPTQASPSQPFGLNQSEIAAIDNANTADGYHQLIEPPNPAYTDPLAGQRYFDNANAKVMINESGNTVTATIYDNSTQATATTTGGVETINYGTAIGTITSTASTSHGSTTYSTSLSGTSGDTGAQVTVAKTLNSAMTFNQSIQDNREDATIPITQINVATLATDNFTGTLYLDDMGSSATSERAFELTNGATIPTGGLTVASDNPVYIAGDYNTGNNPPSDTTDTSSNLTSGYTWQPASVIADAVDILSNAWPTDSTQFTYSSQSLGSRPATNTTINAAIMSGNVPTTSAAYSGGAENFPRFLEDWSNASLTYYGSMVELYPSQQANGLWGQSNVYNPPTRNWHYDTDFEAHPPPGTIMVVGYQKGQWFQE